MRARAFLIIYHTRVHGLYIFMFYSIFILAHIKIYQKSYKITCLIFSKLQRKCIFIAFFLQKYLVISKKSCTFALAFEKQVCFDFLPEARTLKFRFSYEDLIFLRQTERNYLWKIETISVVQELNESRSWYWVNSQFSILNSQLKRFPKKILHLINSIILS